MSYPTIDPTTATSHALVCWLLDDAERGTLREWAGLWLESLPERELREWVRDALPFATGEADA